MDKAKQLLTTLFKGPCKGRNIIISPSEGSDGRLENYNSQYNSQDGRRWALQGVDPNVSNPTE